MPWTLDQRFEIPENEAVLRFIARENPSAHSDVAEVLEASAEGMFDVRAYCPDPAAYACVVLHTRAGRIFGLAYGMGTLAYRVAPAQVTEALADGAEAAPGIGSDWVQLPPWWSGGGRGPGMARLQRWCRRAHDHAVGAAAGRGG